MKLKFILASASPRRREIFENLGLNVDIITGDADENIDKEGISTELFVQELALIKGSIVAKKLKSSENTSYIVISADTVVETDGKILGKPSDREDARKCLESLSGKKHSVVTGIALWKIGGTDSGKCCTDFARTDVYFKTLSCEEIEAYLDTGEYIDKAGSYGIQGIGGRLVEKISGDYLNIVGFPVNKFYELLYKEFGIDILSKDNYSLHKRKSHLYEIGRGENE